MAYAVYTDIEARAKSTMTAAQQTRCNTLLTQMSDYIDGYLTNRYSVPFASPYPKLVVETCILLTSGYFLLGEFADQPQLEAVEIRANNFLERGEKLLVELLNTPSLLSGVTPKTTDAVVAVAPAMHVQSYPRSITLQDSSKWKQPTPNAGMSIQSDPEEYP